VNLREILIGNLFPFGFQWSLELIPELSELLLIHRELLDEMVGASIPAPIDATARHLG
jgi:hypothetical protein